MRNRSLGWKLFFSFEYGQASPLPPVVNLLQIRHQQYMWNNKYDEEGFWISHDDVALACNISGTANIISVVSRETAFDIVFCRKMILAVYHHGATFEGLADEFNDEHCKGIIFLDLPQ